MVLVGLTSRFASAAPVLTTNTLPVTAVDVVGSDVKFIASFSSGLPISYQWQVIKNNTTNDIPGATDNGSGLIANGSGFSNPNAPEGTQAAFVQRLGTISQMFSGFVPGSNYTIRFAAAQRPGSNQHGGQSWDVKIDGNVIASYNPGAGATTYVDYQASFTATATNHILTFAGSNFQGGDNTVFIDHIRFSPPLLPPVVEREPATVESAGIVDGKFFLSGYGTPGQPAVLVTATNLATPIEWVSVATNPPDPEGAFIFSNLFVTNFQQLYRVMVP